MREALWWTFGGRVTVLAFGALLGMLLRTPAVLAWLHNRWAEQHPPLGCNPRGLHLQVARAAGWLRSLVGCAAWRVPAGWLPSAWGSRR